MSNLSFSKARPVTVAIPSRRHIDHPVDPTLKYNTVIGSWDKKPETNIYTIDPVVVLDKLVNDNISDLVDITLGCQIRKDAAMVWDVMFNMLRRNSLIACVFVADENYGALLKNKVMTHSQFLDQDRYNSRLQENIIDSGNKIGMSIYNEIDKNTYILLYTVTGHCHAQHLNDDSNRLKTNALNLKLNHVYVIGEDDVGERLDVVDDVVPPENAHAFVVWLATCVNNTKLVYPWKPHFQPAAPRAFDRQKIDRAMSKSIGVASESTYEEFEDHCRSLYNKIRAKRSAALGNKSNRNKEGGVLPPVEVATYHVPEIEVVTLGDSKRLFVRVVGQTNGFIIGMPEDDKPNLVERFLFNKDLEGRIISEVSGIFVTDNVEEGKTYILRYLTANF